MRRFLVGLISLCLLGSSWVSARAQSAGDVSTSFTLGEKGLTVGDLLTFTLEVRHPAGWQIIVPQARQSWQGSPFEVRDQSAVKVDSNGDGSQTTRVAVTAVLYAPGKFQTPPWSLTVQPPDGEPFEQPIPSTEVEIVTVLKEGDRNLRDLKPQADMAAPPPWLWIVAAVLCLAVLAGLVWWFVRSRHLTGKPAAGADGLDLLPPWQAAMKELGRIEGTDLLEKEDFKQYYSQVTDCLRLLLERQFDLRALDRTTAEVRRDLRSSAIAAAQTTLLIEVLNEADLVKFAKFIPALDTARALMGRARAFVEAVKPDVPAL